MRVHRSWEYIDRGEYIDHGSAMPGVIDFQEFMAMMKAG